MSKPPTLPSGWNEVGYSQRDSTTAALIRNALQYRIPVPIRSSKSEGHHPSPALESQDTYPSIDISSLQFASRRLDTEVHSLTSIHEYHSSCRISVNGLGTGI